MKVDLDYSRGSKPLYVQLANGIEEHITREAVQPGVLLPSESTLAGENALSRATIMKAYELLVDRGRISRRQGKGTFVRAQPMERLLPDLNSFSEHVQGLGLTPSSTLLSFTVYAPGADKRPDTPLDDDVSILVMERLRGVDGGPVGLQRIAMPLSIATKVGLTAETASLPDFSFYRILIEHGVLLSGGEETLRAINAEPGEAHALGVPKGTALIEVTRHSRDSSGTLIEAVRARYLGSKYLYHVTLATPNGGRNETTEVQMAHRSGGGVHAAAFGVRD